MTSLSSQITCFVSSSPERKKSIFLLLTILAGIVILYPYLDYQPYLAQGDHGRDLYSYKITFEGGIPYKDFSTLNGPLMPYYYSLFYHLFDVSISSTLLGYNFCILLAGILIYLICSSYLDPLLSFCAPLWYWAFRGTEFFYTYNHIGGIVMMLTAVYFLVRYIKNSDAKFIYFGFLSIILLLLIRATIGLSTFAAFFVFLVIRNLTRDNKEQRINILKYFLFSVGILISALFIYWLLTKDLPHYVSMGDIAYWKYFKPEKIPRAFVALYHVTQMYFFSSIPKILFTFIFAVAMAGTLIRLINHSSDKEHKKQLLMILGLIFTLAIFNLGELLATGIWFYTMWNLSLISIIFFYTFNVGFCRLKRFTRICIVVVLVLVPLISVLRINRFLAAVKHPVNELQIGKNKIYLHPTQRPLIHTLTSATTFLVNHIGENEKFLAIPYDPIYYFLSNRDSATRLLGILKTSESKERDLLREIEKNEVKHILLSNRAYRDRDTRFGVFGKDYGMKLQRYINEYFEEIATFGPWEAPSGWTTNHAVKIYRRK